MDLRSTKIHLSNKNDMNQFQDLAFELGATWRSKTGELPKRKLEANFMFVSKDMKITLSNNIKTFLDSENTHIYLNELIKANIRYTSPSNDTYPSEDNSETVLKEGSAVLVRDSDKDVWRYEVYSYYDEERYLKHRCVGNVSYNFAIPYEGNEHLVNTKKI